MHISNDDNVYAIGTRITAKENPTLQLIVHQYYHRIYYCAVVGQPEHKHFAYFERELIPPLETQPEKETPGSDEP